MKKNNAIYAQSGGPTAVINATASGIVSVLKKNKFVNNLFISINGILGIINEKFINISKIKNKHVFLIQNTPGCAFGSCRYNLGNNIQDYFKIIYFFKKYNIKYFFYNGGNGSQKTTYRISLVSKKLGYNLVCIGLPKTIDNDLFFTDNSPGFGSVVRYISSSIIESSLDLQSICVNSTKVFILEVMGRNTGWIALSANISKYGCSFYVILFPEIKFSIVRLIKKVRNIVKKYGFCYIILSEGVQIQLDKYLSKLITTGTIKKKKPALFISEIIKRNLRLKCQYVIPGYLQRSAYKLSSKIDLMQSYQIGKYAVKCAVSGKNSVMITVVRSCNYPYTWHLKYVFLIKVANQEKKVPPYFISQNGFESNKICRNYLQPLIVNNNSIMFNNKTHQNYFILK